MLPHVRAKPYIALDEDDRDMRRAGVVLIVSAVLLVIVGFVMRLSNDDEPSASPTDTTPALPARTPPPAACGALGTIKTQLTSTLSRVQSAIEDEDDAALATAVEQAIDRRSAFLTAIGNLEASVDAEYVPDVQTVADSTAELFDRVAQIDLAGSGPDLRDEVLTAVAALRNDEGFQESFSRLNAYLTSCPV